ncbi:multivesicular body subunit 12A [Protopterus annectens]|uniref:multivesicular body subunit 12A n=1 Tax=Protopterus annectens TaxID=7888 RepID=UPI001CF97196|nr:multivesicular body subunit 12A [Protopterus annectens]XP_043940715.1 multivesicular body subunit 12A [Protopterus annectens]XP_043940716.1 multivesicular body subunit 12A [Protopterus annectens]
MADSSMVPLTGLAWASNQTSCPTNYKMITATADGCSANFAKGFGSKPGCYLCYSSVIGDNFQGEVIEDIRILSEKSPLLPGYFFIAEYLDAKASVSKKKRMCAKTQPVTSVDTAVFSIQLTLKNKQPLQSYTFLGELNGIGVWCRKGKIARAKPVPKQRNLSLEMRGLSLQDDGASRTTEVASEKYSGMSKRRAPLERKNSVYDAAAIYGISAMDGIPFALHPKYDSRNNSTGIQLSSFPTFTVKSLENIENEYDYSFAVERTAAARLPPSLC